MLKSWWISFFEFVGFGSTLKNATLKNDPGVRLVIPRLGGSKMAYLLLRTREEKQACARADASRALSEAVNKKHLPTLPRKGASGGEGRSAGRKRWGQCGGMIVQVLQ